MPEATSISNQLTDNFTAELEEVRRLAGSLFDALLVSSIAIAVADARRD